MLQDIKKVILVILLVNPTNALRNNSSLTPTKEQKLADQAKHSKTKSWSTPNRQKINSTKMRYIENVMGTINQQWTIAGCHQEDDSVKDPSTSKYASDMVRQKRGWEAYDVYDSLNTEVDLDEFTVLDGFLG